MSVAISAGSPIGITGRIYWSVAATMTVATGLILALMIFDDQTLATGISVWAKPLKFTLALAIHAATLGWVTSRLSPKFRRSRLMTLVALAFLCASGLEIAYITYQAALGEPSHFNMSSPFNRIMWSAMAIAAVIVIAPAAVIGTAVMLDRNASLASPARLAAAIGLTGGTVLTLITAFSIGANMSSFVGAVPADGSQRMMFTGWSLIAGDLRVSHFLSTHMIQILPATGIVIAHVIASRSGIFAVIAASILYATFTLFEYARALDGAPSLLAI